MCAWAEKESGESPVQPANINAPGQIVISGRKSVLDWLTANFKPESDRGSGASEVHSSLRSLRHFIAQLMKPAEERMASVLGDMKI